MWLGEGYRPRYPLLLLLQKRSVFGFTLGFFRRNHDRGRDLVFILKMQQPDTLRRSASGADSFSVNPNNLPVLADDHEFRAFVDQQDRAHLAIADSGLHIDYAPAAPGLQTIFVNIRAFTIALFGNGNNQHESRPPIAILFPFKRGGGKADQ